MPAFIADEFEVLTGGAGVVERTIAFPEDVDLQPDDCILVLMGAAGSWNMNTFSGFQQAGVDIEQSTAYQLEAWAKVAVGDEAGDTVTAVTNATRAYAVHVLIVRDWTGDLADLVVGGAGTSSAAPNCPSVAAPTDGSLVITAHFSKDTVHTKTVPASYSPVNAGVTESSTNDSSYATGQKTQATAGPTGGTPWTLNTGDSACMVTVAFGDPDANVAPIADAGLDQRVEAGQLVTLNATGSVDPDSTITYLWTCISGNAADIALSSTTVAQPTFTAPNKPGEVYAFQVEVDDGLASDSDVCYVAVVEAPGAAIESYHDGAWVRLGQAWRHYRSAS